MSHMKKNHALECSCDNRSIVGLHSDDFYRLSKIMEHAR